MTYKHLWIEDLKPGDQVAIDGDDIGFKYRFGTVTDRTPMRGDVKVVTAGGREYVFSRFGKERGDNPVKSILLPLSPEVVDRIKRDRLKKLDWTKVDAEKIDAVYALLFGDELK